ncbi:DUF433 domain-containing protein [Rubrivirga sp. S365]|uniref:DUF433 domain-containing protein n=1 Tax=Rubrivirga sp. S365 TaxID=3076080 RepID=UPI0028C8C6DC|nr:DUF433 domain-containing protein [Rubrivirga sp. S365]MDT7858125.1 DUF433 domain-containing protein [Rubrivirga sp. S365]
MASVLDKHIEATPGVCGGKPRIAGRRITVQNVALWHEREGKTVDEIATEYDLTLGDVHAALAYYYDHKGDVDRRVAEGEAYAERARAETPSPLERKLAARSDG